RLKNAHAPLPCCPAPHVQGYMHLAMQGGTGACNIHSVPALVPVIRNSDPCSLLVNPCGGGECIPRSSGKYKCNCPPQFVKVKNSDGTESCTPVVVCTRADINPCGVGTCLNDGKGSHTCLCPRGFTLGTIAVGSDTCVPCKALTHMPPCVSCKVKLLRIYLAARLPVLFKPPGHTPRLHSL
ncbi:unnamed protein product, partial [Closterium sp. NIES-54]